MSDLWSGEMFEEGGLPDAAFSHNGCALPRAEKTADNLADVPLPAIKLPRLENWIPKSKGVNF